METYIFSMRFEDGKVPKNLITDADVVFSYGETGCVIPIKIRDTDGHSVYSSLFPKSDFEQLTKDFGSRYVVVPRENDDLGDTEYMVQDTTLPDEHGEHEIISVSWDKSDAELIVNALNSKV